MIKWFAVHSYFGSKRWLSDQVLKFSQKASAAWSSDLAEIVDLEAAFEKTWNESRPRNRQDGGEMDEEVSKRKKNGIPLLYEPLAVGE